MTRQTIWSQWDRYRDPLLTTAAFVLSVGTSVPNGSSSGKTWWGVLLAALACLPLLRRTRWPLPVAAIAAVLDAVHIGLAGHHGTTTIPAATMLAVYTVSDLRPPRVAWSIAAVTGAGQAVVAAFTKPEVGADLLYLNWTLVAAAIGQLVQERRARISAAEQRAEAAERNKQVEAQRQVTAERMRIARELHDVLAHHITVVNAQAEVAQYLLQSNPAAAERALKGIAENSREALDELRATLGLLRSDRDDLEGPHNVNPIDAREPTPGADRIPNLIDGFVRSGMKLTTSIHGSPLPLAATADLALYRISQEALTNASKHAGGSSVRLALDWSDTDVTLTVTNTPPPTRSTATSSTLMGGGTGHGLLGMRERAAVAGGTLLAGTTAEGGYEIRATLPTSQVPEHSGNETGTAGPGGASA